MSRYHDYHCPAYIPPALRSLPWYRPKGDCQCDMKHVLVYEDDDCRVYHCNGLNSNHGFVVQGKPGWMDFVMAAFDCKWRHAGVSSQIPS